MERLLDESIKHGTNFKDENSSLQLRLSTLQCESLELHRDLGASRKQSEDLKKQLEDETQAWHTRSQQTRDACDEQVSLFKCQSANEEARLRAIAQDAQRMADAAAQNCIRLEVWSAIKFAQFI